MVLRLLIELAFVCVLIWGMVLMSRQTKGRSKKKAKKTLIANIKGLGIVICDILGLCLILWLGRNSMMTFNVPEGELKWSDTRPSEVKLCLPAAYSDSNGKIIGQYMVDGEAFGKASSRMGRTSISGSIFYADYKWLTRLGFQQHTLVLDGKAKTFVDTRHKVRRALCKDSSGNVFILQSNLPMSLNNFAKAVSKKATNAVNLDMGHCGYGFIKKGPFTLPLAWWSFPARNQQTNWIYIE